MKGGCRRGGEWREREEGVGKEGERESRDKENISPGQGNTNSNLVAGESWGNFSGSPWEVLGIASSMWVRTQSLSSSGSLNISGNKQGICVS